MLDPFDSHTTSPEKALDRWLDALNAPERATPPPPAGLEGIANVARRYQSALAATPENTIARSTIPERNGHMSHALPPSTSPNGTSWRALTPPRQRHPNRTAGWLSWLSSSLSTAVVIGLIVALSGVMIFQQNGLPGGSDDPASAPGFAASPEATPAGGTLDCASLGYRAVVEGDVNEDTLAMIGETAPPLNLNRGTFHIPRSNGDAVNLSTDWTSIGGPMWSNLEESTIRNIDTGEEWVYPLQVGGARAIYQKPYLLVPATGNATDWKIIDTTTGDERLISDIRGEQFPTEMRLGIISFDPAHPMTRSERSEPSVWLFSPDLSDSLDTSPVTPIERNALILPVDLDDARFIDETVDAQWFGETSWSVTTSQLAFATGTGIARTIVVLNPVTGESVAIHNDAFTGDALPLMFSADGSTLIIEQPGSIFAATLTGDLAVETVYSPTKSFVPIAHHADSMNVLVKYADDQVALIDSRTGNVRDMPEVTVPAPRFETIGPRRMSYETAIYELFDYRAGTVQFVNMEARSVSELLTVLNPVQTEVRLTYQPEFALNVRYPYAAWTDGHAWLDGNGTMHVESFDQNTASWTVPAPDGFGVATNEVARIFVNPSESCVVLQISTASTYIAEGQGSGSFERSERVATWVAPLESGSQWTKIDTHITGWFQMTEQPEPQTLPAQEIVSPVATPQASPAADTTHSCASPEYRPIITGDANPADLAMIGANTNPITLNGETTFAAANGTEIALTPSEGFYRQGNIILTGGVEQGETTTITSLVTGDSWTFPDLVDDPNQQAGAAFKLVGPWLIGVTDDSVESWTIINSTTGEERLTSDILGAPFDGLLLIQPWLDRTQTPVIISFSGAPNGPSSTIVLPSVNLDDAYALDPEHIMAGANGVITADGSRIAYIDNGGDASILRVLDGFTGELLSQYPLPEAGTEGVHRVIGLTGNDTTLIGRDNQQVWTVDLATGEFASVVDVDSDIKRFEFDNSTGAILVSTGERRQPNDYWINPLTGEVKLLGFSGPERLPYPAFGWALFQTQDPDQFGVDYTLLDMSTGEPATSWSLGGDDNGTNVWITGGGNDQAGIYIVRASLEHMIVLDGPAGQSFELALPDDGTPRRTNTAIGVSPNGECIVYTEVAQPGEDQGTSWVAPLGPDAEWTTLPFELSGWWAPIQPAPTGTPGPAVASPVATPGM